MSGQQQIRKQCLLRSAPMWQPNRHPIQEIEGRRPAQSLAVQPVEHSILDFVPAVIKWGAGGNRRRGQRKFSCTLPSIAEPPPSLSRCLSLSLLRARALFLNHFKPTLDTYLEHCSRKRPQQREVSRSPQYAPLPAAEKCRCFRMKRW